MSQITKTQEIQEMAKKRKRKPKQASEILYDRFFKGKPEMIRLLKEARLEAKEEQRVYDLRMEKRKAKLKKLAQIS